MATASNRQPREVIDFPPNVPVTVALKYAQGKTTANADRIMYSLTDGRVMFLDLEVARQIDAAGINVREPFTITKHPSGKRGEPITWEIARTIEQPGQQEDGTFAVPKLPDSKPMQQASSPASTPSERLIAEANALVDAYAQVLDRTLKVHEGRIKPEEAKTLLITAYIQRSRAGAA